MIFQIDESTPYPTFPDPRSGDEDGLFAVGGDLSIDRLLLAYCHGIFPGTVFATSLIFCGIVLCSVSSSSPKRYT